MIAALGLAGLLILGLVMLLVGSIIERNYERKRCKDYLTKVNSRDSGAD